MISIQKMCESLSNKIEQELNLDVNQSAVVNYGLFAIIQTVVAILLEIILGALLGVLIPTLILSLVAVILRKYSGGVHAETPEECIVIGTVISVGGALIVDWIPWKLTYILVLLVIVFSMAYYLVWKFAPVDSAAKPIRRTEKKQLLKKRSILVLSIYLVACVATLLGYLNSNNDKFLVYIACMCAGIGWQVFTLTNIGHLAMGKIDLFFNKLLNNKGGN